MKKSSAPPQPSCHDSRIARVTAYLLENIKHPLSLAEAATMAGLERTYFCKRFRKVARLGFHAWSRALRIERAKVLLESTDLTVSAIAEAVGYEDLTTFERNFRRQAAMPPSCYRRISREKPRTAEYFTTTAETSEDLAAKTKRLVKSR